MAGLSQQECVCHCSYGLLLSNRFALAEDGSGEEVFFEGGDVSDAMVSCMHRSPRWSRCACIHIHQRFNPG